MRALPLLLLLLAHLPAGEPPPMDFRITGDQLHADLVRVAGIEFADVTGAVALSADKIRIDQLRATAYGGKVIGAVAADAAGCRLQLALQGVDLNDFLSSFGKLETEMQGRVDGQVVLVFQDNANDRIRGGGRLRLDGGAVISLPAIATALLSKPTSKQHDDRIEIDFTIANNVIRMHRIRAVDDAMTLTGHGTLDFLGRVDVVLTPRSGTAIGTVTDWIPLVGPAFKWIMENVTGFVGRFEIVGHIADPIIRPKLL